MKKRMIYCVLVLAMFGAWACGKEEPEVKPAEIPPKEDSIGQKCVKDSFPIPFYSLGTVLRGTKFPEKIIVPKIKVKNDEKIANYIIRMGKDWDKVLESPIINNPPVRDANALLTSPALCGRMKVPNDDDRVLNEWISKTCEGYIYHVEIGGGSSGKAAEVVYFSQITEAIPEDIKVRFDVVYSQFCKEESENIGIELLKSCELSAKMIDLYSFNQVNYVINNQEDYKRWVASKSSFLPSIDFTKYTLLAGKFTTANQDGLALQSVEKACEAYNYTVFAYSSSLPAVGVIHHFAIIPKIGNESNVRFTIKYQ